MDKKGDTTNEKKHMIERSDADIKPAKRQKISEDSMDVVSNNNQTQQNGISSQQQQQQQNIQPSNIVKQEENINNNPTNSNGSEQGTSTTTSIIPNPLEEKRKKDEEMKRIEQEFSQLKEKFFNEKIAGLKKEIEQLQQGTHEGFLQEVKHLEEKRQKKTLLAEQWKRYQLQCIDIAYESEKKQADDEFLNDTKELKERMVMNMINKRKALEEEKANLSLNDNAPDAIGQRSSTRTLRKRGAKDQDLQPSNSAGMMGPTGVDGQAGKKPVAPDIRIALSDEEVDFDFAQIQRSIGAL